MDEDESEPALSVSAIKGDAMKSYLKHTYNEDSEPQSRPPKYNDSSSNQDIER